MLYQVVKWGMVSVFSLSCIGRIDEIGVERKAVTKTDAVVNLILNSVIILGIVTAF